MKTWLSSESVHTVASEFSWLKNIPDLSRETLLARKSRPRESFRREIGVVGISLPAPPNAGILQLLRRCLCGGMMLFLTFGLSGYGGTKKACS